MNPVRLNNDIFPLPYYLVRFTPTFLLQMYLSQKSIFKVGQLRPYEKDLNIFN